MKKCPCKRPCGLHSRHGPTVNVVFYVLITSEISTCSLILSSSTNKFVPLRQSDWRRRASCRGYFAPASADRGTPSPTSLWLVDLPPLAVCSFNSLFQPYSRPRCRVADCQSRLHPRFRLSVPICQRAIFPSLPRAAYLPSALRSGNLYCALLGIEPNACLRLARHAQGLNQN